MYYFCIYICILFASLIIDEMSNLKPLFSSSSDLWSTPQDLFDSLNSEFHFDIDVCAVPDNAKCDLFISPLEDGLIMPWSGRVWCNPPYGRDISKWVYKASIYSGLVVMLLPARTDTKWFHDYIYNKAEIRFIRGRLHFGNSKNAAPFPSMIVIFNNNF